MTTPHRSSVMGGSPTHGGAASCPGSPHASPPPLGGPRPRVDDRQAMEALCCVRRTGCQGHALRETGLCSSRCAHRRLHAWAEAGGFVTLWQMGLTAYDALHGLDWERGWPWTVR